MPIWLPMHAINCLQAQQFVNTLNTKARKTIRNDKIIENKKHLAMYLPDCALDLAVNTVQPSVYMPNTLYSALKTCILHDTSNQ